MPNKKVLVIGLDPDFVDFSLPELASSGITAEKIRGGLKADEDKTRRAAWEQAYGKPLDAAMVSQRVSNPTYRSRFVRSDGRIFATAGWDSAVRVYSAATLKELAQNPKVVEFFNLGPPLPPYRVKPDAVKQFALLLILEPGMLAPRMRFVESRLTGVSRAKVR